MSTKTPEVVGEKKIKVHELSEREVKAIVAEYIEKQNEKSLQRKETIRIEYDTDRDGKIDVNEMNFIIDQVYYYTTIC